MSMQAEQMDGPESLVQACAPCNGSQAIVVVLENFVEANKPGRPLCLDLDKEDCVAFLLAPSHPESHINHGRSVTCLQAIVTEGIESGMPMTYKMCSQNKHRKHYILHAIHITSSWAMQASVHASMPTPLGNAAA